MLEDLRKKIDEIDNQILELVAQRTSIVNNVASNKIKSNSAIYHREREVKLLERLEQKGAELGLKDHLVRKIFFQITAVTF